MRTEQEVIKYLENHGFIADEVKDMCIKAINKQIHKIPYGGADIQGNFYEICQECSAIVGDSHSKYVYCPDCGQRIDWGGLSD